MRRRHGAGAMEFVAVGQGRSAVRSLAMSLIVGFGLATPALAADALAPITIAPGGPGATLPLPPTAAIALKIDESERYTVPVRINGQGPFRFIIDTGADRSVISDKVAARLGLVANGQVAIHSMSGLNTVGSVTLATLQPAPGVIVRNIETPILSEGDLGAEGLLGVDSLQGQEIVLDFTAKTMEVRPASKRYAPQPKEDHGAIIIYARSRFGQLILVDSDYHDLPIRVVLDTGGEVSVANSALRRLVHQAGHGYDVQPVSILSVVGKSVPADYSQLDEIHIGKIGLEHTPVAFADVHPFDRFGLTHQPAMLLGMDMMRLFRRVTIDFANRRVSFVMRPETLEAAPPSGARSYGFGGGS